MGRIGFKRQPAWKRDGGPLCCRRGRVEGEDKESPEAIGGVEVTFHKQTSGERKAFHKKIVEHSQLHDLVKQLLDTKLISWK